MCPSVRTLDPWGLAMTNHERPLFVNSSDCSLLSCFEDEPDTLTQGHINNVTSVAFSPDGQQLATGSRDNTARVWDMSTSKQASVFEVGILGRSPIQWGGVHPMGRSPIQWGGVHPSNTYISNTYIPDEGGAVYLTGRGEPPPPHAFHIPVLGHWLKAAPKDSCKG